MRLESKNLVAVHIGSPAMAVVPLTYPAGNRSGQTILFRLVKSKLAEAGLLIEEFCQVSGAELNDCVIYALVTDEPIAVELLKMELQATELLPFSQIGVSSDGVWRCVYPAADLNLDFILCDERREAAAENIQAACRSMAEKIKLFTDKTGEQPPEADTK